MNGLIWYVYRIDKVKPRNQFDSGERWRYHQIFRSIPRRWVTEVLDTSCLEKYIDMLKEAAWYKKPRLYTADGVMLYGKREVVAGISFDNEYPKIWFGLSKHILEIPLTVGAFWPWLQMVNIRTNNVYDTPLMIKYRKVTK